MAWKGRPSVDIDYQQLRSTLVSSGMQKDNNDIFEVISSLIGGAQKFKDGLLTKLGREDKINSSQISGRLAISNGGTYASRYTPTLTLVSNLTGAGVDDLYYHQIDDLVSIFGRFQVTPVAIGVNTELGFTLPILSYFDFDYNCAGCAYSPTVNQGAAVLADVINQRALLKFLSVSNLTFDLFMHFGYRIIEK